MKKNVNIPIKYPVVSDPKILGGTPVIYGTRIPASLVLDLIRRGYNLQILKDEYPSLTPKKLSAFMTLMSESFDDYTPKTL
jgi:uncharacterized protein (DUF433 family)